MISIAILAAASAVIVSIYGTFSETVDEPVHIAAGMQWLDRGSYTYQIANPPLARIAAAIPPYFAGLRSAGLPDPVAEGNALLYAGGRYVRNLSLFRLGALPFFLLAASTAWWWARRLFGPAAAAGTAALFSTLPPVLGHSALATTDAAIMATATLALFLFTEWLDRPTLLTGALLGAATGLSVLSKFSALLFLPCAAAAIAAGRWLLFTRAVPRAGRSPGPSIAVASIVAVIFVWAGYRFAWGPTHPGRIGLPAPAFVAGVRGMADYAAHGHPAFLLGEQSSRGWWYYFPVALLVKTPLAFLLLTAAGAVGVFAGAGMQSDWKTVAPLAAAAAILASVLPSRLDIGIRHILPIYPLLAILAGLGLRVFWTSPGLGAVGRFTAIALVGWQLWSAARTYPDYMAYFNELAERHPERVLLDSNLDWGQDLLRLSTELARRGASEVALCYFGNAEISRHGLPSPRRLTPNQPTTGWIAISEMCLLDPSYSWLKRYEPVGKAGRSIRLYHLEN